MTLAPNGKYRYQGWLTLIGQTLYGVKRLHRRVRITRPVTAVLGPQYRRCRNIIEIDVTYDCDLKCLNCNRSCRQAPSAERMELAQIEAFVEESRRRGKVWRIIKVLGGEPTLHPHLTAILRTLLDGCARPHGTSIILVTNGFSERTREIIQSLPKEVIVDPASLKDSAVQPQFGAFNMAPADSSRFRSASFRNACQIPRVCGIGLTPFGYYGCAIAGGIDRVAGYDIGRKRLPDDTDEMEDHFTRFCPLCGRFIEGHFIPWNLKRPLREERLSPAWQKLYAAYQERPPRLTRYRSTGGPMAAVPPSSNGRIGIGEPIHVKK
jgi:hypothetical protein